MRRTMMAAVLGLALATGAQAREGSTLIGAGATFMLGGEQTAPIAVRGANPGPVPVLLLRARGGRETAVREVAPGQMFDERFGAGETVLFRNRSARQASIDIRLTPELFRSAMRYDRPDGEK